MSHTGKHSLSRYDSLEALQISKLQNRRPLFDVELHFTVYKSFVSTSLNIIHRSRTIWIYEIHYIKNELSVLLIETQYIVPAGLSLGARIPHLGVPSHSSLNCSSLHSLDLFGLHTPATPFLLNARHIFRTSQHTLPSVNTWLLSFSPCRAA